MTVFYGFQPFLTITIVLQQPIFKMDTGLVMQEETNQLTKHLRLIYFESPCLLTGQGWIWQALEESVS